VLQFLGKVDVERPTLPPFVLSPFKLQDGHPNSCHTVDASKNLADHPTWDVFETL